ncbi:hypothetical protein ACHAWF_005897 [Thalassiosira exigua]
MGTEQLSSGQFAASSKLQTFLLSLFVKRRFGI